jgi:type 1 glutamine amidotransferase
VRVHYVSRAGDAPEPFVWTRRHGDGRVCYCAAGHTTSSMRHPAVQRLILQGLRWCIGEPV